MSANEGFSPLGPLEKAGWNAPSQGRDSRIAASIRQTTEPSETFPNSPLAMCVEVFAETSDV